MTAEAMAARANREAFILMIGSFLIVLEVASVSEGLEVAISGSNGKCEVEA